MLGAVLAALAGFIMAVGVILIRRGLSNSNFFSSVMATTLIGNIVFWPILLVLNPKNPFNMYGLIFLALAGFLHPGLVRLLYTVGMLRVGVSVNASITATYPLFSTIFAILLLSEQPTVIIWLGIVFVVVGAMTIQGSTHNESSLKGLKGGLLIPVGASITAGLGYVFKKMGLNAYSEPVAGAAVAYLTALILYVFILTISPKMRSLTPIDSHTLKPFGKGGLCIAIGQLLVFYALQYGYVTVVTPILQTEPLFILLLTHLYLRRVETLSKKIALGTVSIVIGVILITTFKG